MKQGFLQLERWTTRIALVLACLMLVVASSLGVFQIVTRFILEQPAEIESVIFEVEGVADAVVAGGPDDERGEHAVAFISVAPGTDPAAVVEAVEAACAEHLAGYKRPRRIEVRDEIPRDPTGKVLRTAVRKELWEGA